MSLWCWLFIVSGHLFVRGICTLQWNLIQQEMLQLRTCRSANDSCPDERLLHSPSGNTSIRDLGYENCFCDDECWHYGDCCLDKGVQMATENAESKFVKYWKCENVSDQPLRYVYMVSSCPADWEDENARVKCERNRLRIPYYTYEMDLPVVSDVTNFTYANIYCAQCHNAMPLANLELAINCSNNKTCLNLLPNSTYRPGLREWVLPTKEKVWFSLPQLSDTSVFRIERKIRQCWPVIEKCDAKWTNSSYVDKCSAFASYVKQKPKLEAELDVIEDDDGLVIFKNQYCAECNYARFNQTCFMKLPKLVTASPQPASFSLLLDFRETDEVSEVGKTRRCPAHQVYNPVDGFCFDFPCGQLYEKINGNCVRKIAGTTPAQEVLENVCPKLILSPTSYRQLPNGSIYVNFSDTIYNPGEYEWGNNSVLICSREEDQLVFKFSPIQGTLSYVVLGISVLCLGAHIAIYGYVSKLRNLPGKNLLSLAVMLFCAQILFFGVTRLQPGGFCEFTAVMMHFCFLASFFWMNIMAIDICRTFTVTTYHTSATDREKNYRRYATYAWGFSAFIVACSVVIDNSYIFPTLRPQYGTIMCWITQKQGLLVFFAIPLGILLIENIIFFSLTARGIYRSCEAAKMVTKKSDYIRLFLYIKLAVIMGLTWIIGFVAAVVEYEPLWYGFIILNGSQGTFIFFAFSFKRKVIEAFKEKFNTPDERTPPKKKRKRRKKLRKSPATSMSNLNTTTTRLSTSNLNIHAV